MGSYARRVDPITDNARLLLRMRELFPPEIHLPGVDIDIVSVRQARRGRLPQPE